MGDAKPSPAATASVPDREDALHSALRTFALLVGGAIFCFAGFEYVARVFDAPIDRPPRLYPALLFYVPLFVITAASRNIQCAHPVVARIANVVWVAALVCMVALAAAWARPLYKTLFWFLPPQWAQFVQ